MFPVIIVVLDISYVKSNIKYLWELTGIVFPLGGHLLTGIENHQNWLDGHVLLG